MFILIILGVFVFAPVCLIFGMVNKYNMPKVFDFCALINVWGLIIVAILVYKPNGYADQARKINCPNCGGRIDSEFRICPFCRMQTCAGVVSYNMMYTGYQQMSPYAGNQQMMQYSNYQPMASYEDYNQPSYFNGYQNQPATNMLYQQY